MKSPLRTVAFAGVALLLSACGTGYVNPPLAAPSTTIPPESNMGGDRLPVQMPGEDYGHHPTPLTGTAELRANGCWTVDLGDGPRLVVFPAGYVKSPSGAAMESPDGVRISDGMAVDARGGIVGAGGFPGVPDGFWGNYIAFCDPQARELVVVDSIEPAFDPQELSDEQLVAMLREADLTVSWGCGLGFTIASEDQRVALQLFPVDMSAPVENTATFPSEVWQAQVALGKNLMVNNCDDVFEGWEPEPHVAAGWRLIAGDLAFTPPEEGYCAGSGPVEAQLTGVEVDTPLGPVQLGDLSITNDAYGCFAG